MDIDVHVHAHVHAHAHARILASCAHLHVTQVEDTSDGVRVLAGFWLAAINLVLALAFRRLVVFRCQAKLVFERHDTSEISKVADRLSFANVIHDYLLWPMKAYVVEAFPRLLPCVLRRLNFNDWHLHPDYTAPLMYQGMWKVRKDKDSDGTLRRDQPALFCFPLVSPIVSPRLTAFSRGLSVCFACNLRSRVALSSRLWYSFRVGRR